MDHLHLLRQIQLMVFSLASYSYSRYSRPCHTTIIPNNNIIDFRTSHWTRIDPDVQEWITMSKSFYVPRIPVPVSCWWCTWLTKRQTYPKVTVNTEPFVWGGDGISSEEDIPNLSSMRQRFLTATERSRDSGERIALQLEVSETSSCAHAVSCHSRERASCIRENVWTNRLSNWL